MRHIDQIVSILRQKTVGMTQPATLIIVQEYGRDPFLVLISCLLSLRTRDAVTLRASRKLFEYARTPDQMLNLSIPNIQELIYPVGFYQRKAHLMHSVSADLLNHFQGNVPHTMSELLSIKGIGPKTANLVLAEGFGIPALCVDTHVHRISNRLGLIKTDNPVQTETALRQILPQKYWIEYCRYLVMWGQNICVPISPFCSRCALFDLCQRIGVTRSR